MPGMTSTKTQAISAELRLVGKFHFSGKIWELHISPPNELGWSKIVLHDQHRKSLTLHLNWDTKKSKLSSHVDSARKRMHYRYPGLEEKVVDLLNTLKTHIPKELIIIDTL